MGSASIATASLTAHPEQGFLEALDALGRALDEVDAPSMIIGGVAVIALGIPRLTVDISPALKRRIKVAAAAQDMPVSAYVARVLGQVVPASEAVVKASDGAISSNMTRRAEQLRAEQRAPFLEDSADLIREAREQRHTQL